MNQVSATQRNGRMNGNRSCGCGMNTPMMGNRGRNMAGCNSSRTIQDGEGRRMEVECVCKVTPEKRCYMDDPMEKLGCRYPIAMAYVPWQQWGELYDAEFGLKQGTIFKDLNKIFCGVRC